MKIREIFQELASEGGSNMKMTILSKYKDNELLKRVLYLANSRRVKFYIKQIPNYTPAPNSEITLEDALSGLESLSKRIVTGHDAINHLYEILSDLDGDDAYIIERIIEKDCKIGMGTTNMNKVIPGLIEETPYMGAKAFSKDLVSKLFLKGPAYSQMKMDGRYANAIIRSGEVELISRQGETTYLQGSIILDELGKFPDCVLNGELTMDEVSRYESNGIIASLVSILGKQANGEEYLKDVVKFEKENGMTMGKALSNIRFTVWDTISIEEYFAQASSITYDRRLALVEAYIADVNPTKVSQVQSTIVSTHAEAMEHFQNLINQGHEGTILKAVKGAWKDGKPVWQIKLKLEIEMELRITGFRYGTGKNSEVISTVEAESEDGLLKTAPTGISEKEMKWITDNQSNLLGKIITAKCSGVSQDHLGNYSLLHPVYKHVRDDKSVADTLKSILDIEAMAKGLK